MYLNVNFANLFVSIVSHYDNLTKNIAGCPFGDSIAESCEPGWSQMEKKCYKLETTAFGVNWNVAEDSCRNIGAHIASIESQCEQNTVVGLSNGVAVWTGGNDQASEGTFVWLNGNEFYKSRVAVSGAFTFLSTGFDSASQSTQHCVQLGASGEWDDVVCSKTLNYVCEKAAYEGAATLLITTIATTTSSRFIYLFVFTSFNFQYVLQSVLLGGPLLVATVTSSRMLPRPGMMPQLTVQLLELQREKLEDLSPSQALTWSCCC